ncbi:BlaI/MecI/CopY family transcriptional regulator [Streptomyces sp. NBC_00250]|uniref:BlaI/MecI/CopY family transcriptional regulator n=1 Tax=Streptomyces sp. NBC_00250 TaxID=2903641 RepID=UPI002E27E646|nr:BlaI/MecI/CopY family transcriptional regulator [Streptomyces sp. NBC_00250]
MTEKTAGTLSKLLGPLGAEALTALWRNGRPLSVRQVQEELNRHRPEPLAYTTVMTVLSRLAARNVLRRTPAGRGFLYEPLVADAAEVAVRDVIRDHGVAAVAHFVDQCRTEPQLRSRLLNLMQPDSEGVEPG